MREATEKSSSSHPFPGEPGVPSPPLAALAAAGGGGGGGRGEPWDLVQCIGL